MGSHSHSGGPEGAPQELRVGAATRQVLCGLVACLALVTGSAVLVLWPSERAANSVAGSVPATELVAATVLSVRLESCPGLSEDRLPNGDIPASVECAQVTARLEESADVGRTVTFTADQVSLRSGITAGTRVRLSPLPGLPEASGEAGGSYALADFDRRTPLQLLGALFVVLVVAMARLRGLAALGGLGLGYLAVWQFMIPALRAGENPAAVAFAGCTAVMLVILYLSHGVSAKTTCALLGTTAGLALTSVLAHWATRAAHLSAGSGEDALALDRLIERGTLAGLVVCGMIVAGLGVLNDVTVTQASAVWELRQHAPHLGRLELFTAGMRIGRDHLASTVYTIAFVYAGSALPTLLLIDLYQRPWDQVLTSSEIAQELVATFVGGIGLILAIPLTTGITALVAATATGTGRPDPAGATSHGHGHHALPGPPPG